MFRLPGGQSGGKLALLIFGEPPPQGERGRRMLFAGPRRLFLIELHVDFRTDRRGERADHPVVVPLGDWVVLVVMAAGTPHRQPQQRLPQRRHDVVQFVVPMLLDFVLRDLRAVHSRREIARRPQRPIVVRGEFVSRQLPLHELVVRQVSLQRFDHKIAVGVGGWAVVVVLVAVALGEPHQVQPVPGPAFAKLQASQPLFDLPGEDRVHRTRLQGVELSGGGGQARQ